MEGLRANGPFLCPYFVSRVPAPVPDLQDEDTKGSWYYRTLDNVPAEFARVDQISLHATDAFCPAGKLMEHETE